MRIGYGDDVADAEVDDLLVQEMSRDGIDDWAGHSPRIIRRQSPLALPRRTIGAMSEVRREGESDAH